MSDAALAIYILIIYSWLVGWLIACGRHHRACKQTGKRRRLGYLGLLFFWPHYLGF